MRSTTLHTLCTTISFAQMDAAKQAGQFDMKFASVGPELRPGR